MENICLDHENFKKESFIKLLGYEGISAEKAKEIYDSFDGNTKKMAQAINCLMIFRKLDTPAYLAAMDYLAKDNNDMFAKATSNN